MHNLFLSVSFLVSAQVCIFPLNISDMIIYVAWWWEKYLSKHSLIKHTCSWCDKLIVLWRLNRQAKIFLRIRLVMAVIFVVAPASLISLQEYNWPGSWFHWRCMNNLLRFTARLPVQQRSRVVPFFSDIRPGWGA